MIALADPGLLLLIVSNGLRNAAEAVQLIGSESPHSIAINWGTTDRDYWVAIMDDGCGLPKGTSALFEIGTTTKDKNVHLGMGLAIAKRAASSLGGSLTLNPRSTGGTTFELRWPIPNSS
jgi:C4-dicarboxylate-specific signal transduction histidine kinase